VNLVYTLSPSGGSQKVPGIKGALPTTKPAAKILLRMRRDREPKQNFIDRETGLCKIGFKF
jgi:hypothetical protein